MKKIPFGTFALLGSVGYFIFWGTESPPYIGNFLTVFLYSLIPLALVGISLVSAIWQIKDHQGKSASGTIVASAISLLVIFITYFLFYISIGCSKGGGC